MKRKLTPMGYSDFKQMNDENRYYVDKTDMIREIYEGGNVILIPRPRRFGKTLNLSMLRYFFGKSEKSNRYLFEELNVYQDAEMMEEQGKYPLIYLTFKDVKVDSYESCMENMKMLIAEEYRRHRYVLEKIIDEDEINYFKLISSEKASIEQFSNSLRRLSQYLSEYHQEKVFFLLDEYDTPIQYSFVKGYYEQFITFMRNLLGSALKDNVHLKKSVLTGILRVAKESIFSGLNNLDVYTLLHENCNDKFGFTEKEVETICEYFELSYEIQEIKDWYNGYNFGGVTIYNPFSIVQMISKKGALEPHWVNTSDNALIKDMLKVGSVELKKELEMLVNGELLVKEINQNIVYKEVYTLEEKIWSFLLFSGYLKTAQRVSVEEYELCIPNKEVKTFYLSIMKEWFTDTTSKTNVMLEYLTAGKKDDFISSFEKFVDETFSYFDVTGKTPEKFYHGFVLGLVSILKDKYTVKSNKESGDGRYDVMLIPKDKSKKGIIFEFKSVKRTEKIDEMVKVAMMQIEDRGYESELRHIEITDIVKIAIAFKGKKMRILWE